MNSPHIVYAGSNAMLSTTLSRLCRSMGCQLVTVPGDGAHAMEAAKSLKPLFIFLSSALDGTLGAQETAWVIEQTHRVPTVLVMDSQRTDDVQNPLVTSSKDAGKAPCEMCTNAHCLCGSGTKADNEREQKDEPDEATASIATY